MGMQSCEDVRTDKKRGIVEVPPGSSTMTVRNWILALPLVLAAAPAFGQQPVVAGHIKVASGAAFIVRAGGLVPAQPGQAVYESDSLRTAADGRVGITLK